MAEFHLGLAVWALLGHRGQRAGRAVGPLRLRARWGWGWGWGKGEGEGDEACATDVVTDVVAQFLKRKSDDT